MYLELVVSVLAAVIISLLMNRFMLTLAPKLGLMDDPGERRIHAKPIPRAGGLAIWLSFILVLSIGLATGYLKSGENLSWNWLSAFTAGSGVLIIAGIFDDRKGLSPFVKLAAHILAPLVFFLIRPIESSFLPEAWPQWLDITLLVIWTVVLINAFNLIDGLDGLCGGLATLATLALGLLCITNERFEAALVLFVMAGSLLGFLKYNFNPAQIFLGDAGSMLLGFFLATAASESVGKKAVLGVILLPIAVAGVPLLDVLLAIWRRGAKRVFANLSGDLSSAGIFSADSDHLHHRILRAVGSQRKAALILQVISAVLAFIALLPLFLGNHVFAFSLVSFIIIALVAIRYLMRIEIEHTGSVIHLAIKLPGRRRRLAAALFVYDMIVLMLSTGLALLIETNLFQNVANWVELLKLLMIFIVLSSVMLFTIKIYQRLWVRATARDLLNLQVGLLSVALLSFAIFSAIYAKLEWSALRLALISFVTACTGISLPRVIFALLREWALEARCRNDKAYDVDAGYGPVVIIGAGDMGELFLEHLKSVSNDKYPHLRVLGFLDHAKNLHGRVLRSFPILGGFEKIPSLVREKSLKGMVLAIDRPKQELLDQLNLLAAEHNLRIYRWGAYLTDIETSKASSSVAI